jgi:hypothetical protein
MIFQNREPFACARIPVKLKFAKIQTADAPPSLPVINAKAIHLHPPQ